MSDPLTTEEVESAVGDLLANPREVEVDGQRVVNQDLDKAVVAARFLAAGNGMSKPGRGLRFTRLIPPGTVG